MFVGAPAHHVGLVVAPGLAIEAPHRGCGRALRAARRGRLDVGRTPRCGRGDSLASAISLPPWVPGAASCRQLLAASREVELPAASARGTDRGRERLRSRGGLGCRRARARPVPAGDVVRVVEPVACCRARSTRTPRSTRRRATCGGLVDRAAGDLGRALAAYHDGWNGQRACALAARDACLRRRASCAGSEDRRSSSRTPTLAGHGAPPVRALRCCVSCPSSERLRTGDFRRSFSSSEPRRVDMPPQGS